MCLGVSVFARQDVSAALGRGVAVVAVGTVVAALGVWAAAVPRPDRPILRATPTRTIITRDVADVDLAPRSEVDAPPFLGARRQGSVLDQILGWGATVLVAGAVLLLLALLVRALLRAYRDRRAVEADDATGPDLERVATAVATDAEGRLAALSTGTPAEGIVAAWEHLERSLRTAGLPLPPSRTSTETTVAALGRFVVDAGSLHELAALYREACWSRHPMREDDRARAADALRALDAQLRESRPAGASRG